MSFTRQTAQKSGDTSGGAATTQATTAYNQPAGELLVVAAMWESANGAASVADTAGNTYTPLTKQRDASDEMSGQLFYCLVSAAHASNIVTLTLPAGSAYRQLVVHRYTPSGTVAFVAEGGNAPHSTSTNPSISAITAGNAAVFLCKEFTGTNSSNAADTNWTEQHDDPGNGSHTFDRIDSPGGTYVSQCTLASTADWLIAAASFSDTSGGTTRQPSVGTATLTGVASTVVRGTIIVPLAAALTITGTQPTVSQSGNVTRQPSAGSLTLTGTTVTQTLTIPAPGSTTLTLTGNSPVVVRGTIITPSVGALSLTGIAPVVVRGTVTVPNVGALTLTGIASTLTTPQTIQPSAGSLVLNGIAPTISISGATTRQPSVGALAFTGNAPTVSVSGSISIQPAVGSLSLSGVAPTVVRGTVIPPSAGSIAFTGIAPSLFRETLIQPSVGSLAIVANSPTLSGTTNVTIVTGVGSLTLTGKQVSIPSGFIPANIVVTVRAGNRTVRVR